MSDTAQQDDGATAGGTANIGVVGLAVMGSNLARNLASREGNTVAVFNRSPERTRTLVAEHPEAGFVASESVDDFVASLARPRTAIIMVQAGHGTDAVISQLADRFEAGEHAEEEVEQDEGVGVPTLGQHVREGPDHHEGDEP